MDPLELIRDQLKDIKTDIRNLDKKVDILVVKNAVTKGRIAMIVGGLSFLVSAVTAAISQYFKG